MGKENPQSPGLIQLCESAFHAEFRREFVNAFNLHSQTIAGLNKVISEAGLFDGETKDNARKQVKFHNNRMQVIASLAKGTQGQLSVIIPTSLGAEADLQVLRNGRPSISVVRGDMAGQIRKAKGCQPKRATNAGAPALVQAERTYPILYPTLNPELPPTTYHIYAKHEIVTFGGSQLHFYKAKSDTKLPRPWSDPGGERERETLYVLKIRKQKSYQIPMATLHRASEFQTPCVAVVIAPVKLRTFADGTSLMLTGRDFELHGATGRPVKEVMDRKDKTGWGPRRFSYGGRQFVWVSENGKEEAPQTCYEVERVWPKPGSQTGKKEHKLVEVAAAGPGGSAGQPRRLCWGESNMKIKKTAVIHMAGGLDQLFQEYLLASQLTRWAVLWRGHNH